MEHTCDGREVWGGRLFCFVCPWNEKTLKGLSLYCPRPMLLTDSWVLTWSRRRVLYEITCTKHSVWNPARTHRSVFLQHVTLPPLSLEQLPLSSLFPVLTPSDSNTCSSLAFHHSRAMNTHYLFSPPTAHAHPTLALFLPNQHLPPTSVSTEQREENILNARVRLWASGLQEVQYLIIICFCVWHHSRLSSTSASKT